MNLILNILLVLTLLAVVYQDVKMRLIHIALPIAILILGIALKKDVLDIVEMGMSLLFLLLNFVVITIYFSIKKRAFTNPFDSMIGWGDVVFLIALIPLFPFRSYLVFFVFGMLFSLLLFTVMRQLYPTQNTIPLAGYLSIFVLASIVFKVIPNPNFFV